MGTKNRQKVEPIPKSRLSGLKGTRDDAERAFREMVKSLRCPGCALEFTDAAVDWSDIWWEGRFDLLKEMGKTERDGPCKLRCERCGHRSWLNYFARTITSAEDGPT